MSFGRKRMSMRRDRKVFSNTAVRGKKININPRVARGGVRL